MVTLLPDTCFHVSVLGEFPGRLKEKTQMYNSVAVDQFDKASLELEGKDGHKTNLIFSLLLAMKTSAFYLGVHYRHGC